jgi:hypothetical protein
MKTKNTAKKQTANGLNDRKTDVKLDLIPEQYTKWNILLLAVIVLVFLTTQYVENSKEGVQANPLKYKIEKSKRNL